MPFPQIALSARLNQQNELCPQGRHSSAWVSTLESDQLSGSIRLEIKGWLVRDSPETLLESDQLSGSDRLEIKGWLVQDSPETLCCVLEQDNLSSA